MRFIFFALFVLFPTFAHATPFKVEVVGVQGFPAAGTTGQVLSKSSATDYDTAWSSTLLAGIHLKSTQSGSVTATTQTSNGSTGTCTKANSTDVAGVITITPSGSGISTGDVCELTFATAYAVAPVCLITPTVAAVFVDAVKQYASASTTKLTINFGAAGTTGHIYTFNYFCLETQ